MGVNLDKPSRWKQDIGRSVDLYNTWFIRFAPEAFRNQRVVAAEVVEQAFIASSNLKEISPAVLKDNPSLLPILRMACCPPLARERLAGLAYVPKTLIDALDKRRIIPPRMKPAILDSLLGKVSEVITQLIDPDIVVWQGKSALPSERELERARTIIADRLCGAAANPIIRNAQEARQKQEIKTWLEVRGYEFVPAGTGIGYDGLQPGQFAFGINLPVAFPSVVEEGVEEDPPLELDTARREKAATGVNVSVDIVVMPKSAKHGQIPLLIEAKSAGDFTNTNKRRKEEAKKIQQLFSTYGEGIQYIVFLCGYFNSGYLGYCAADGIDWVWEHRIDDLAEFAL